MGLRAASPVLSSIAASLNPITASLNPKLLVLRAQVVFPERAGALKQFLTVLSPKYNMTLFHYRKSGNRSSQVLLGLQLPPSERAAFAEATAALGDEFSFGELSGAAKGIFEMFIQ